MANNNVKQVICRHYIQGFKPDSTSTCNYGAKCFKYHPTREDWRGMNKNMSPCFEYCATGKCTGHDGQGCNFAKNTEDYKEACEKRGKVVDLAVVLMLEQGAEKEKKAAEAANEQANIAEAEEQAHEQDAADAEILENENKLKELQMRPPKMTEEEENFCEGVLNNYAQACAEMAMMMAMQQIHAKPSAEVTKQVAKVQSYADYTDEDNEDAGETHAREAAASGWAAVQKKTYATVVGTPSKVQAKMAVPPAPKKVQEKPVAAEVSDETMRDLCAAFATVESGTWGDNE